MSAVAALAAGVVAPAAAAGVVVMAAWRWRPPPGRIATPRADRRRRGQARPTRRRRPRLVAAAVVAGRAGGGVAAPRRGRGRRRRGGATLDAGPCDSTPPTGDCRARRPTSWTCWSSPSAPGSRRPSPFGELASLAPAPFAAAFAEVDRRVGRGQRLADAVDALPEHLGEPARAIAATISGAERYGAPLAPALELLAHDARRERRRPAEETARTLPVKLCFPLVCCTLPAFVLLTIAPLVAGALRSLRL